MYAKKERDVQGISKAVVLLLLAQVVENVWKCQFHRISLRSRCASSATVCCLLAASATLSKGKLLVSAANLLKNIQQQ